MIWPFVTSESKHLLNTSCLMIAQPDGALGRIRRAVAWIRDNYNTRLRIEALCDASGMSRASLHRHFLSMTGLSPIQYRKQLRLQLASFCLLASIARLTWRSLSAMKAHHSLAANTYGNSAHRLPATCARYGRRSLQIKSILNGCPRPESAPNDQYKK